MRAFLFGVGCAIIGAASGFAGGYAYNETRDTKPSGPGVYCYDPNGPVHLNGDPVKQVCVPTGR